ncbi:hypothetical protein CRM22_006420, partial [Opisthorchis felineus]
ATSTVSDGERIRKHTRLNNGFAWAFLLLGDPRRRAIRTSVPIFPRWVTCEMMLWGMFPAQ